MMLKAITLWEPWATLLATGKKRIETRSWPTDYRGPVAIHAAMGGLTKSALFDKCRERYFDSALNGQGMFPPGHILAVGNLSDCLSTDGNICLPGIFCDYPELDTPQERAFGDYSAGRYGFVFTDVKRLPSPVPFKSRQGRLIDLDYATEYAVRGQWWQRCCPCPVEAHILRTHEVERGSHYCRGCNSIHDQAEASI